MSKGKVTGIGGVFFKSTNPQKSKEWYSKHLGLVTDDYGSTFESRDAKNPESINYLQWSPFQDSTDYFAPAENEFMINYRVEHLDDLLASLKASGVTVLDEIASFDYGRFVHILDNEGRKIELWEPIDQVFTEELKDQTTK